MRLLAGFALVAGFAHAQTVTSVTVSKSERYVQTSSTVGPTDLDTSNANGAADFQVAVQGTGLTSGNLTAPVVTLATGSTYATANPTVHNNGTLTFNSDGYWGYGFNANPADTGQGVTAATASQASPNITTYFANANYTVVVNSTTLNLSLAPFNTATNPAIPTMTFSQGTWANGVLNIDPTLPLTITTSSYGQYLDRTHSLGGHLELGMLDANNNFVFDVESYSGIGPTGVTLETTGGSIGYTIPANTLTAGSSYLGMGFFDRIVSQDTSLSGSFSTASFDRSTAFTVTAIPEPSTCAAAAGLGAFALAAWRRRRVRA